MTGNKEIKCKEGTILWDTIAMAAYALGVTPLIHFMHEYILVNKQWCEGAAFADDFSVAGKTKKYQNILGNVTKNRSTLWMYGSRYSRMDRVKFVEDSL